MSIHIWTWNKNRLQRDDWVRIELNIFMNSPCNNLKDTKHAIFTCLKVSNQWKLRRRRRSRRDHLAHLQECHRCDYHPNRPSFNLWSSGVSNCWPFSTFSTSSSCLATRWKRQWKASSSLDWTFNHMRLTYCMTPRPANLPYRAGKLMVRSGSQTTLTRFHKPFSHHNFQLPRIASSTSFSSRQQTTTSR